MTIKLSRPRSVTFILALLFGIAGFIGYIGLVPLLGALAFWLVFIGWVLLVLGVLIKGM